MSTCEFHREGNCMVCEHGVLRLPIIPPHLLPGEYSGSCGQVPGKPSIEQPKVYLQDVVTMADDREQDVWLARPPCTSLGDRTDSKCKKSCGTTMFLPVYRCSVYRFCSPFGKNTDPELIHPCPGCPKYVAREEANGTAN